MKSVIDSLVAATGWVGTNCTIAATTWTEFAASYLPGQTRMTFAAANATAAKTFTANVAGFSAFAFNIVSQNKDVFDTQAGVAGNVANMRLKVKFVSGGSSVEYWVPLTKEFVQLRFANQFANLTQIVFTATAAVDVFISEIIAYNDEMPYDGRFALSQLLGQYRDLELIQIGTLTANAGDTTITTTAAYLDVNHSFKIGNEICQIKQLTNEGTAILKNPLGSSYVAAPMYLYIPIGITEEEEDVFPAIKINDDFAFESDAEIEPYSTVQDSFNTAGDVNVSLKSPYTKFAFTVEGSAREKSALEIISRILRKALTSRDYVWINGRRHELEADPVIKVPYGDATDIYDKIQTIVKISAGEDIWPQETQPTALTTTVQQPQPILPPPQSP